MLPHCTTEKKTCRSRKRRRRLMRFSETVSSHRKFLYGYNELGNSALIGTQAYMIAALCRLRKSYDPRDWRAMTHEISLHTSGLSFMLWAVRVTVRRCAKPVAIALRAQSYPSATVSASLLALAPGGAADIFARLIGDWLSRLVSVSLSSSRTDRAPEAASPPRSSCAHRLTATLFSWRTSANVINASFRDGLNFVRDSAPVAMLAQEPIILSVNPSLPPKTLPGIHRLCQGQSRQAQHGVAWQRNRAAYRRRVVQAHGGRRYDPRPLSRGAPALTDLMGGQVQVAFMGPAASTVFH